MEIESRMSLERTIVTRSRSTAEYEVPRVDLRPDAAPSSARVLPSTFKYINTLIAAATLFGSVLTDDWITKDALIKCDFGTRVFLILFYWLSTAVRPIFQIN